MLTSSLVSSLSIIAVFLLSLTCCRSSEIPGHMVRTFQLPKRIAGYFLVFRCLPGAVLPSACCAYTLSFKHPLKQAVVGESAPYWLGAAQLRRAVADQ